MGTRELHADDLGVTHSLVGGRGTRDTVTRLATDALGNGARCGRPTRIHGGYDAYYGPEARPQCDQL